MERFFEVLRVVLPIVAALALGWVSRRRAWVSEQGIAGLKALVMHICLPATLLQAFYTIRIDRTFLLLTATVMLCCLAALFLGRAGARVLGLHNPLVPFLCTGFEAGMMGYGLYIMRFGVGQVATFAMVDLGQVLFVFTVYMAMLHRQQGVSGRQTLLDMVRSPVFLAICAGLLLAATGLGRSLAGSPAGPAIDTLLTYLAAPTGMVMIFVVGYGLVWNGQVARQAVIIAGLRAVIVAALCAVSLWVLSHLIVMDAPLRWAYVLLFTLPAPFVLPVFTDAEDPTVSVHLSLYALLSIAAFAVMSAIQ